MVFIHFLGVKCLPNSKASSYDKNDFASNRKQQSPGLGDFEIAQVERKGNRGNIMPSASLLHWQSDRMPNMIEIDAQCARSLALAPPNPRLVEENLRGYVVLLSAHFQGFCRDLYTEAAQIISLRMRRSLQLLVQTQFSAHRKLDRGNPNLENVRSDFKRFGFILDWPSADPANVSRLAHLSILNAWRNIAAHQGTPTAAAGPLILPLVQSWRNSCDGLAVSLDGIMYNQLRRILRRAPWVR